jgi:hypothetical protein
MRGAAFALPGLRTATLAFATRFFGVRFLAADARVFFERDLVAMIPLSPTPQPEWHGRAAGVTEWICPGDAMVSFFV